MKHLSRSWAALALLAPVVLVAAVVVFPLGCGGGGGSSATPVPTMGRVEIGFVSIPGVSTPGVSSPTGVSTPGIADFQRILLNIVEVRVNPSTDLNVSELDPNWRDIPAPPSIGGLAELQINLSSLQDSVQLLNTTSLPAQQYNQIEVLLDPNNPGTIVPNCPKDQSGLAEGCVSYRFQIFDRTRLRVLAPAPLQVTANGLSPLVLSFDPGTIVPAGSTGGPYTITPNISVPDFNKFLGKIEGTVSGVPAGKRAFVSAEVSGTDQVVASAPVGSDGVYILQLPAQDSPAGTSYDLFVSGDGIQFATAIGIQVFRGASAPSPAPIPPLQVSAASTGVLSGKITDSRTGLPIQGATLDLLLPPQDHPEKCQSDPSACVVVATASTDEIGNYPLPGGLFRPQAFDDLPLGIYTLRATAAGYDPALMVAPVNVTSGNTTSASLTSTTISGTVTIDGAPAAGSNVQVLVAAEDTGTDKLENLTMVTIPGPAPSAAYTLIVPTLPGNFDLFATAQDFIDGSPSPFPGHTIEVLSSVPPGATSADFALQCAGHGSLTGMISVPGDGGTTVRLSKNSVQLMESQIVPEGSLNAKQFSFCAPPDNYTVQRYEGGLPAPGSTPVPETIATPVATSSPCPICSGMDGKTCPGFCSNTDTTGSAIP